MIFHPFLGGWGRKKVSYGAVDLSNDYGHGHRQAYRLGKYIKRNDQFKSKPSSLIIRILQNVNDRYFLFQMLLIQLQ